MSPSTVSRELRRNADRLGGIDIWNQNPKPFVWTKTADEMAGAVDRRGLDRAPGPLAGGLALPRHDLVETAPGSL